MDPRCKRPVSNMEERLSRLPPGLAKLAAGGNSTAGALAAPLGPRTALHVQRLPKRLTQRYLADRFMWLGRVVGCGRAHLRVGMHGYLTFQSHRQLVRTCAVASAALGTVALLPGWQPAVMKCFHWEAVRPAVVYRPNLAPLGAQTGAGAVQAPPPQTELAALTVSHVHPLLAEVTRQSPQAEARQSAIPSETPLANLTRGICSTEERGVKQETRCVRR